ncbi:hypothetical protein [Vibrio phage vB_VaS_L1]|nr:hypothetical protein [Vibrio phage vB_VaS_L1]
MQEVHMNKVKPFYIRINDDMTPQMVQDAFDKCHKVGIKNGEPNDATENLHDWNYFGVCREKGTRFYDSYSSFRDSAQEITLNQLDEWLGLEAEEEWDGWDSDGYADVFPKGKGIDVLAFIDAKVNGINGPKGRWVEAKTVCCCYHQNGGAQVVVEFNGRNYAISALTYLRKPETPEQKAEREKKEEAAEMIQCLLDNYTECNNSAIEYVIDYLKECESLGR